MIHSQFLETPYIEVIFEDIKSFRWESGWDLDPAYGIVVPSEVKLMFGPYQEKFMISGKKMKYRILGREFLGKECRTVQQIF